jgi:putative ABC transport system permease protein
VSMLDRKLLRDLAGIRGQVTTIALVVAVGVAVFVASISTYNALNAGRDRFYAEARFPQVFVSLKRAPLAVARQIAEIPGVATVVPRIVRDVVVDLPSAAVPVSARMVSLTAAGDEPLARLHLRRGSAPEPGDSRSAAISEGFAESNAIAPGGELRVVLNGRVQPFRISGIALSAEYVYAVKPGVPIPDDRFFAILWIDRSAAEAAFDMTGAFNDVVVSLAPGAEPAAVIADLDRLLEPYGSVGAIARRDQPSNRFLEDELNQQRVMSVTIPLIFFGIAAFLLNVALGRLVTAQREQIAALKALGYPSGPLMVHYLKLVAIVVMIGALLGLGAGFMFGVAMIASYQSFFRFPSLVFELTPWSVFAATAISFIAASFGVLTALRAVLIMPPAVAMRPPAPLRFHRALIERLVPGAILLPSRLMGLRNFAGRPLRSLFTVAGIALAVPMVILGLFWRDAVDHMIDVQFNRVERGNVWITFPQPRDVAVLRDLAREPGVLAIEGQRVVPVRLRAAHRTYMTSIIGLPERSELRRPHTTGLQPVIVPPEGVVLTRRLGERLGVAAGDTITVEVMEGRRRRVDLPVSSLVDEMLGMATYMNIDAVNRLTGEGAVVSAAALRVEPSALPEFSHRLKNLPVVESVSMRAYTLASFIDKIANLVFVSAGILTGFGIIIAVGVVYNSVRIALHERAWELSSLRVLGFTRNEVAGILLGQYIAEIAIAIPLGLVLSRGLIDLISRLHSNESFQIPAVIEARTYIGAIVVVVAAALASAYIVRRRIDHLDMVASLKTRD